jgi:hypothetical protein
MSSGKHGSAILPGNRWTNRAQRSPVILSRHAAIKVKSRAEVKPASYNNCVRGSLASRFVGREQMNPNKLFDYLEGRLPPTERAALEDQLISDQQLQRELAIARRIHAGMDYGSPEVFMPPHPDTIRRNRKMALRVGAAFIILMAVNVVGGLWLIARHESKNPNRSLLETQTRDQIMKALEHAAATALTPPPSLGISEIRVSAAEGQLDAVADEVVALAGRLDGSATKGLPDDHRIGVLVDLPSNRESQFRAAIASISGAAETTSVPVAGKGGPGSPTPATAATAEKTSFIVQIVEGPPTSD